MTESVADVEAILQAEGYGVSMTTKEVCDVLRIQRMTLYTISAEGKLKRSRIGGKNLYLRRWVAEYIAKKG